eukprot:CAMPEP_0119146400 /NCGR_PEP_ID=MMETSP1310-20130426/38859_1 /TAXON_ID=464262 /ORGANISM="Genus nov. species nov., Strain RCC2339" /LENGTH=712 /DNA_ID=CAMNT_0007138293 /DNA_START=76 /DNA_END=2214 /DNA_ORIENTATION=-
MVQKHRIGEAELESLLKTYDTDRNGILSETESLRFLKDLCKMLKYPFDEENAKKLIQRCDNDSNGGLDLHEFKILFLKALQSAEESGCSRANVVQGDLTASLLEVEEEHDARERREEEERLQAKKKEELEAKNKAEREELVRKSCILAKAAMKKNTNVVKKMLQQGASPNIKDREKKTPLHYAAEHNLKDMAAALVAAGAAVNEKDQSNYMPIHYGTWQFVRRNDGALELVKILVEAGSKLDEICCDGNAPLHNAVQAAHSKTARYLLEKGANVNLKLRADVTALHKAAYHGRAFLIPLLVTYGADVNAKTTSGVTPLMEALRMTRCPEAMSLIEENADVNVSDVSGWTALHYACKSVDHPDGSKMVKVISVLLERGANVNALNKDGHKPMRYAPDSSSSAYSADLEAMFTKQVTKLEKLEKETPQGVFEEVISTLPGTEDGSTRLVPVKELNFDEDLEDGMFGKIYQAFFRGHRVSVLSLVRSDLRNRDLKSLEDQALAVARLSHPNLVYCWGVCPVPTPCLCMEDALPDLYSAFDDVDGSSVSPAQQWLVAFQIASGMEAVHRAGLLHRDLRAQTVFVGPPGHRRCRLVRYGIDTQSHITLDTGKRCHWLAPEIFASGTFSTASDVFAFGVVLYEVATLGRVPLPGMGVDIVRSAYTSGEVVAKTDSLQVSDDYGQLMRHCWAVDPAKRPDFQEIVARISQQKRDGNITF